MEFYIEGKYFSKNFPNKVLSECLQKVMEGKANYLNELSSQSCVDFMKVVCDSHKIGILGKNLLADLSSDLQRKVTKAAKMSQDENGVFLSIYFWKILLESHQLTFYL